jgi:hypothetical protein
MSDLPQETNPNASAQQIVSSSDVLRKLKNAGCDAEESLLIDRMENRKTDCPKPSGFADINAYRNEIELYSTETLQFLDQFTGTNEDLWKEVRLALCPEAFVAPRKPS